MTPVSMQPLYMAVSQSYLECLRRDSARYAAQHVVEALHDVGQLLLEGRAVGRGVAHGGGRVVQDVRD